MKISTYPLSNYLFSTLFFFNLAITLATAQTNKIYVRLDSSIHQTLTGRLYIFTQADTTKGVTDPDGVQPAFYKEVRDWKAGQTQVLDANATGYPLNLPQLKRGVYKVAALFDANNEERGFGKPGNYYSRDVRFEVKPGRENSVQVTITGMIKERAFKETSTIKLLKQRSSLLSDFRRKDIYIEGAVILPANYDANRTEAYPLVFVIPGWGGTHYDVLRGDRVQTRYGMSQGKDKIYVYLNPETQTPFGLHAFVDSRVNGPWGKALVEEIIPYLEQTYHVARTGSRRFVIGQSSGGYGALWLQLHYPKAFGACWAVSPDPVDFSAFTGVNLYRDKNYFYNAAGKERGIFFENGKPKDTLKRATAFEDFQGDGGQLQSFEAAFGLPDDKGKPKLLVNRQTGAINKKVLADWKTYDLALFTKNNWAKLAPDLDQKIHVYAGAEDNFLLYEAVLAYKEKTAGLKGTIVAETIPGANHFTVWSEAFTQRVQTELDSYLKEGS